MQFHVRKDPDVEHVTSNAFDVSVIKFRDGTELAIGIVVDSPPPKFAKDAYLRRLLGLLSEQGRDGSADILRQWFLRFRDSTLTHPDISRRRVQYGAILAFSIGGIALTSDNRGLAFRLGKFRVVIDGNIALREETLYRPENLGADSEDGAILLTGAASRSLPESELADEDILVFDPASQKVEVFFEFPFRDLVRDPHLISISCGRG